MSDLLSGLGALGLGNLQGMDLYEEDKEKAAQETAVKEEVIDETEFLIEKTYECPICGRKFKSLMPKTGKSKLVSTDMDLRPVHEHVDLTKYDVIVCQNCGYAVLSRYHAGLTERQKKNILEKISHNYKSNMKKYSTYTYEDALARYQLALVNSIVKQAKNSEKAYICLKAGWLMRGYAEWLLTKEGQETENAKEKREQALKMEDDYLKNAFEGFQAAMAGELFPIAGMDESTMNYLLAVLAYRFDKLEVAGPLVSKILTSPSVGARTKDKARDLKDLIVARLKEKKS